MAEKIFDLIRGNLKNPRFYMLLLVVIFVILLLFPYIDANFFYYDRVEKRVNILKEISEIDQEKLKENPVLESEYESILSEISKQKEGSIGSMFITNSTKEVRTIKFVTGAMVSWFVAIICLFAKFEKFLYRLFGILLFVALGAGIGYIAQLIPTIIQPMCNYIFVPIFEMILLGLLLTNSNAKKSTSGE